MPHHPLDIILGNSLYPFNVDISWKEEDTGKGKKEREKTRERGIERMPHE